MAVARGCFAGLRPSPRWRHCSRLLAGDLAAPRAGWPLLAGVVACWAWRRRVEQAGACASAPRCCKPRATAWATMWASLPVGWFTPQNTARLSHIVTQGTMAVAQLPAHVFTPVIGGLVTPFVIVAALFAPCTGSWG